jgi:hypothetical protein
VIEHVIGWDLHNGEGKQHAGAFGDCEAWYTPIEEQGRKTLHSHFLIWIKGWSKLLKGLYSANLNVRNEAAVELASYAEHVVSTKLFGLQSERARNKKHNFDSIATSHVCNHSRMVPCELQKLRNMRYKYCPTSKKELSITKCECCQEMFTTEELINNVLSSICGKLDVELTDKQTIKNMRVLLISENSHLLDDLNVISDSAKDFLLQLIRNMHSQRHTFTCFKKNDECRARVPNRPCEKTKVHFFEEDSILWHDWNGTKRSRTPYMLEMERHPLDVFMNQYNPTTSRLLQSNTNVQLGIDGAHIMYCTCYACKSNKKEEKQSMIDACEGLLKRVKKELRDAVQSGDEDATEAPNVMAFKRMFVSILSCTKDYVLSAPLAKYLIANDTRFLCSHEFTNIPFYDFKNGNSTEAKLHVNKNNKAFISSSRDTYIFRPTILSSMSTSDFYAKYMVKSKSKNPSVVEYVFQKDAPKGYKNLRCIERSKHTIPVIYHEMMEDAKLFGGNILSADFALRYPERLELAEECAKKMLILFMPFRSEKELLHNESYLKRLRLTIQRRELTGDYETSMQNMQDCRNSLNCGKMEDLLERNTKSLEEPGTKENKKKKKRQNDVNVRNHLDEKLSELIADINEAFEGVGDDDNSTPHTKNSEFTLKHIRAEGSNQCGVGDSINPNFCGSSDHSFIEVSVENSFRKTKKRKLHNNEKEYKELTTHRLLEVKSRSVKRNVELASSEVEKLLENVNATGSIQSILAWSKIAFTDIRTQEVDLDQQQAFTTIIADFILTYLPKQYSLTEHQAIFTASPERTERAEILKWKKDLYRMRGLSLLKNKENLIMFITGAGGSGKSHVINNVLAYASKFCSNIDQPFDKRTIVVTAMTGVAATSILGETAHSAMCLNISGGVQSKLSNAKGKDIIDKWKNARFVILDEISFANQSTLKSIIKALEILKQDRNSRYGGMSIVFTGDFLQLEPVSGGALFVDNCFEQWYDWINCFVELFGGHRFKDKSYMRLLTRLRVGSLTKSDYDELDKRVINGSGGLKLSDIPDGTQVACHLNKDRSAVNNAIFAKHLSNNHSTCEFVQVPSQTIVIKASHLRWTHSDRKISLGARYNLFNRCRDSDVETSCGKKFRDPLLKLYHRVPLMLTDNEDVPKGIANGTIGELLKVVLIHGGLKHMHKIKVDGYWVNCIESQYVEKLLFTHGKKMELTYELTANEYNCSVDLPLNLMPELTQEARYDVKMKMFQFPVLVNHATTVHKLQGQTKESLFVTNYT